MIATSRFSRDKNTPKNFAHTEVRTHVFNSMLVPTDLLRRTHLITTRVPTQQISSKSDQ